MSRAKYFSTRQVAEMAGVHRDTLLRWLREKRIAEPTRDRNGWRAFSLEETQAIMRYAEALPPDVEVSKSNGTNGYLPFSESIARLEQLDWDFVDAKTGFLTHSIHPYPAKYIPQIPNALIQELSSVGETILDPFCGSGTTLVEALRLDRNAVGVDANPLACLISSAKTTRLSESEVAILKETAHHLALQGQTLSISTPMLFPDLPVFPTAARPSFDGVEEWFDAHIIDELAYIKASCLGLPTPQLQQLALVAMSSIIVTVSRQDSDTRYVRREKNLKPGDTLTLFSRALNTAAQRVLEFSDELQPYRSVHIHTDNILNCPDVGMVDLVVCSPPYPNAYSYHLYHRTRMLWLDMDQPEFKRQEIGSHRKYSSKSANAATVETFRVELRQILEWLSHHLRPNRHACFVIGDSTVRGERIKNDELLISVGQEAGFKVEANIPRTMQAGKKSFNPAIGKIKQEHIVILRNSAG